MAAAWLGRECGFGPHLKRLGVELGLLPHGFLMETTANPFTAKASVGPNWKQFRLKTCPEFRDPAALAVWSKYVLEVCAAKPVCEALISSQVTRVALRPLAFSPPLVEHTWGPVFGSLWCEGEDHTTHRHLAAL